MYTPTSFQVEDEHIIDDFLRANAFGQLLSTHNGRISGSYLPFLYDSEAKTLLGHLARVNPQATNGDSKDVLVTFEGAHGYISPSWYTKPGVPTWDYQAVHVYGTVSYFSEPARLAEVVDALSNEYERHEKNPWIPDYPVSMLDAIVGVEIQINEIQAKFKLSQNRSQKDIESVCEALDERGGLALSRAIREANNIR